jgi:hypothetical protein
MDIYLAIWQLVYLGGILVVAATMLTWVRESLLASLDGSLPRFLFATLAASVLWPATVVIFLWIIWHGYEEPSDQSDI